MLGSVLCVVAVPRCPTNAPSIPNNCVSVQEECSQKESPEIEALKGYSEALMASIPFKSNHILAQPMYEALGGGGTAPGPAPEFERTDDSNSNLNSSLPSLFSEEAQEPIVKFLPKDDGGSDVNTVLVVGMITASAVLVIVGVLVGVVATVFVRRQRAKQRIQQREKNGTARDFQQARFLGAVACPSLVVGVVIGNLWVHSG